MLVKYKPIIRKEGIEELVSAELISGELCVTVLKSWPTFAEAKAHEGDEYLERDTTITEKEAQSFIYKKEADAVIATTEAEKQEALNYLKETDYVLLKILSGRASKEDYKEILEKRDNAVKVIRKIRNNQE